MGAEVPARLLAAEKAWIEARGAELRARWACERERERAGLPVCYSWMHRGGYDATCPSCDKSRATATPEPRR